MQDIKAIATAPTTKSAAETAVLANVFYGVMPTALAHPLRVTLNRASLYSNPYATLKHSLRFLPTGFGFNLLRGSAAVSLQSKVKIEVQQAMGGVTASAKLAGIAAAAGMGGLVATFVETMLVRRNHTKGKITLLILSPSLSTLYLVREFGFSMAAFGAREMSPVAQYGTLFAAAWLTAGIHKYATVRATADILPPEQTIPNFKKEGAVRVLKNIIAGDVYSHPAFKVIFPNPATRLQSVANGLNVFCGPNMFFWRFAYLAVYAKFYDMAIETYPHVKEAAVKRFSLNR